jgi:hypothetical protein
MEIRRQKILVNAIYIHQLDPVFNVEPEQVNARVPLLKLTQASSTDLFIIPCLL